MCLFLEKTILLTDQYDVCMDFLFEPTLPHTNFGACHFVPILLIGVIGWVIIRRSVKQQENQQWKTLFILSLFPFASVLARMILTYVEGTFTIKDELPFHLCRTLALVLPILVWKRNIFWLNVFYFLIICGTLQAIITADLQYLPPHYSYFIYWVTHVGLVVLPIYWTIVLKITPTLRHLKMAVISGNVYLVFALIINKALGSNYFYVSEKPPGGSILDLFGPWPTYIFVVECIALILFVAAFLPFIKPKKSQEIGVFIENSDRTVS